MSAVGGRYREISRAEINSFLVSAINLAMAKPEYINGGVRVIDVKLNADGVPRLDFDNGDFAFLDFEHLVPRDSAADPLREKRSTDAFYGAECPSYPNCSGGCGLGCTHNIESKRRAAGVMALPRDDRSDIEAARVLGENARPTGRLRQLHTKTASRFQQEWAGEFGNGWFDIPNFEVEKLP